MKLVAKEAAVLGAVAASNSLSVETLATLTNLKHHTIRHYLSGLISKKIIFKNTIFDSSLLGYQTINILFSVPSSKPQQVLKYLKSHPLVSWLAENSGDAPYEITCLVQHVGEVEGLLQEVSNEFSINLGHREWAAETEQNFLGYKHLVLGREKPKPITIGWSGKRFDVDDIDLKIIQALRTFPHASDAELAKSTGIPTSTLDYRSKRLRKNRVIAADLVFIDPVALGLLEVQMLLTLQNLEVDQVRSFREYIIKYPAVISFIRCFGPWDYKLVLQVQSYSELFSFQDELRQTFPNLIDTLRMIPRRKLHQIAPMCTGI